MRRICNNCGASNSDDAIFCYNCGKQLVEKNVMDKYKNYHFVPTNLMNWKKPRVALFFKNIFLLLFIICTLLLVKSVSSYNNPDRIVYDQIDDACVCYAHLYYLGGMIDVCGVAPYYLKFRTNEEAFNHALDIYNIRVRDICIILSIGIFWSAVFIYLFNKPKPHGKQLRELADYIQSYRYHGILHGKRHPLYKFFIKDNKFGLMNVSLYKEQIPAKYTKLSWKEKDKYLIALDNNEEYIIDINGQRVK